MRVSSAVLPIIFGLVARDAASQDPKDSVPPLALSCTMESPASYRNHVVSVTISEQDKSATVQGRPAKEVVVEYLRFVILEEEIRWVIDRGTGRFSMFTTGGNAPRLFGNGACQLITTRKF